MATVTLTPGDHIIEWSLEGYDTITAKINISTEGIASCIDVITHACEDVISIAGLAITGILKSISADPVCTWINGVSGWQALATFDIMELIEGYLEIKDLGFTVTSAHIMGSIAYYNNQLSSGNALTGCDFT